MLKSILAPLLLKPGSGPWTPTLKNLHPEKTWTLKSMNPEKHGINMELKISL